MNKINIIDKLNIIDKHWVPKIIGELNGQAIKIAKLKGDFVWHNHQNEDEMFFVIRGQLKIEFRDSLVILNENEFCIVPKGIDHRPIAEEEVHIMLFEPLSTINTGNIENEFTKKVLEKI